MTYQPQPGDVAFTAVSSSGQSTLTIGYLTAGLEWMPTAPNLMAGQNSAGNPVPISTDNSGNVNVNVVSGGGSGGGTVAISGGLVGLEAGSSVGIVGGTVTALPFGTQTVAGTLTTLPSAGGTQSVVQAPLAASGVSSVYGSIIAAGAVSAIFTPAAGRPFNVAGYAPGSSGVAASLAGTLYLQKSIDGGASFQPVTGAGSPIAVFSTVFSETYQESQVGVQYQLVCSANPGSSPINYRFAQ